MRKKREREVELRRHILALENELTKDLLSQRELEDAVDSVRVEVRKMFWFVFDFFGSFGRCL